MSAAAQDARASVPAVARPGFPGDHTLTNVQSTMNGREASAPPALR